MENLRSVCRCPLGGVNLDNVKPGLEVSGVLKQIELRAGPQPLLLTPVYKFGRRAVDGVFAQLDLHKAQAGTVGGNQINLSEAAAPVGSPQLKALAAQISSRLVLPPPAQQATLLSAQCVCFLSTGSLAVFKKLRRWMGLGPYWASSS